MKTLLCVLLCAICFGFVAFGGSNNTSAASSDYLRIHIRANSNLSVDQNVKYAVKDKVVEYLTPLVALSTTREQIIEKINANIEGVNSTVISTLRMHGHTYTAKASIKQEYFPTRAYENALTLSAGVYDALIIELGSAKGDNWWCVIYPPLCFVNSSSSTGVVYKSKILEIIENFFKGR